MSKVFNISQVRRVTAQTDWEVGDKVEDLTGRQGTVEDIGPGGLLVKWADGQTDYFTSAEEASWAVKKIGKKAQRDLAQEFDRSINKAQKLLQDLATQFPNLARKQLKADSDLRYMAQQATYLANSNVADLFAHLFDY